MSILIILGPATILSAIYEHITRPKPAVYRKRRSSLSLDGKIGAKKDSPLRPIERLSKCKRGYESRIACP